MLYMKEHPRKDTPLKDIYEWGVYYGDSLKKICDYLKDNELTHHTPFVFGFDSFQGLPLESEGIEVFDKFKPGSYKFQDNVDAIRFIREKVDYPFLYLVKGLFNEILNKKLLI